MATVPPHASATMFTHQHHLRHLLQPEHYTSEAQHSAEMEQLFHPAWHPVATTRDLARPGDFLTLTILDTPLLLRNVDGERCAFLNVCPHRHSELTSKLRGRSQRFICQYHGWEYRADGRTGQIPDARAFRPWDRENSCLRKFRLEACGELLFVNLSDNEVSLRDWLDPVWDEWQYYGGVYRHAATWEKEFPCNWKVVLENSLESYHIPQVHPLTFKEFPPEEEAWHELTDSFTSFKTIPPRDFGGRITDWLVRRVGHPVVHEYWHRCVHPHVTGASLDVMKMMQCVFPTGPRSCRYRSILFTLRGRKRGPSAWGFYRCLKTLSNLIARKVFAEDAAIYGAVQRGIESSPHPGVIGTREERIYYFQKFVLDRTQGKPRSLPLASWNGD